MKILFISSGNGKYGISPIVLNQGISLQNIGLEIDFYGITGKGIKGYLKNINLLRKKLEENEYRIIHFHYGISSFLSPFVKTSSKIVISFMGDDLLGSRKKNGKISGLSKIISFINILFSKYIADFSIVKSVEMEKKLRTQKKIIIPNGVNINDFYPMDMNFCRQNLNLDLNKKIILFAANPIRPEKNFKLTKMAYELIKNDSTILLAIHDIPQKELLHYYNACNCIVLTSTHEGSPNVIKETMACNRPIVSTPVGDVKWLIEGVEGCYVTSFGLNDIAEKINTALVFSEIKKSTNGREKLMSLGLDSQTTAFRIEEVYKKLIK